MPAGRPRGNLLDPSLPPSARSFPADVDGRWRVRLAGEAVKGFQWLEVGDEPRDVLGVMRRPGVISFRPWDPEGLAVAAKHRELEEFAESDASAYAAIAELNLMFNRFCLAMDGVIILAEAALFHLRVKAPGEAMMIIRTPVGVELWSHHALDAASVHPNSLLTELLQAQH